MLNRLAYDAKRVRLRFETVSFGEVLVPPLAGATNSGGCPVMGPEAHGRAGTADGPHDKHRKNRTKSGNGQRALLS